MRRALVVAAALVAGLGLSGACRRVAVTPEEPALHAPCASDRDCLGDQLCTEVPGGRTCELHCTSDDDCGRGLRCSKDNKLCEEAAPGPGMPGYVPDAGPF